jgi:hypothetical protein
LFHEKRVSNARPLTLEEKEKIVELLRRRYRCGEMKELIDASLYSLRDKVFMFPHGLPRQLHSKVLLGAFPIASIGLPILLKRNTYLPLLPLGPYLVDHCQNKLNLPDRLSQKLLYGKKIKVRETYSFEDALLVDNSNEFLAFLRLRLVSKGTEIIPVLDIGWYLREGG